jgi:hypothetical protein
MLNWLKRYWPALILAALLIALLDAVLSSLITCQAVGANASGGHSANKQQECTALAGPILLSLSAIIDFADDHGDAITGIFTVALATFTGRLWFSTEKLWNVTNAAVRLASDEFNSTHRPSIRIKHVWLLSAFWYSEPVNVRVVCVNRGTTDAKLIEYGADFLVVRRDRSLPPDHQFSFCRQIDTVLRPGVSGPFPDFEYTLTQEIEIAIRHGEADFYCIGFLHYADKARNIRTTAFCRKLILEGQRSGYFVAVEHPDYEYQD